jgi:hypothetical protein
MSEVYEVTNFQMGGPWLLARENIERLDAVLNSEWEKLEANRTKTREAEIDADYAEYLKTFPNETREAFVERTQSYRWRTKRSSRELFLLLEGSEKINLETFGDAVRSPALANKVITYASLTYESGAVSIELKFNVDGVTLAVAPSSERASREAFVAIRSWFLENQPPAWARIWVKHLGWTPYVAFAVDVLLLLAGHASRPSQAGSATSQARALLENGIEPGEEAKALDLILRDQYELHAYVGPFTNLPMWTWVGFGVMTAIAVILINAPPPGAFGIGKGVETVKSARRKLSTVGVKVPGLIVAQLVMSPLFTWFRSLIYK